MARTNQVMLKVFTCVYMLGVISPALVLATTDISQLATPTGRVSLFSFERGHLRTVTDLVDTEVVLNAPPRYFEAYVFECNATFPVQWAYIGEAAPVVTADVGRFFQDFYDVNTYTYQTILLMYSLQELQSGRYICRGASKEHDKLAIHYDVFVPGNGTQILLSTSEKKLFIPETKEHAYIPCGVSDSTAVINLYRGNQWGTFYPVPVNGSITFNPRKGFKVRFKDFLDPWGTYLCVSESNKKRRKVHLIPESLKAKYDSINQVSGKIPVYFSYEYEYNRVLCCTGTNFIPKLQWAGCGSILDCQVKSACFEEDRCEQRLGNSGYNPTKWIDPGPLPPGCSGYRLRDDPNGDFGLFKCSTPGIAQYQPYLLNRGNIFLDFEKTPPSEMILSLQRISPEGPSYVGDELEFHCNSTRFYFAYGIRWGWEKAGGEIEFINDANVVRDKYSIRGHRRRTTLRIPHPDIKSIICFVPVVNSATEWRTVSLPVVMASTDVNFISHQSPVPNNVVDLEALTYHTDYDTPNPAPAVEPQQAVQKQQQENPEQNSSPPQHNLQEYKSAKTPYQEITRIVPTSSPPAEHQPHQNNLNYYSYTHDASKDTTHLPRLEHNIPDSDHHPQIQSNDIQSHQSRVHPISQQDTGSIYSSSIRSQAFMPSPNIMSISRSKKNRNRSGSSATGPTTTRSGSRTVPNLRADEQYIIADDGEYHGSAYDTYEPRPSSSSYPNSKLHNARTNPQYTRQSIQSSSTRIPHQQEHSSQISKRPSSSTSSSSRRPNYSRNDITYSSPKKAYRDYTDFNNKDKSKLSDSMRLSLPFEPAIPSRSSYGQRSNYSTLPAELPNIPVRSGSNSISDSGSYSGSTNIRRPVSSSPSQASTSSRPLHKLKHDHNIHSHQENEHEQDYTIDDSYSQHVRLKVPSKSVGTHLPKQRGRTHQTNHAGHGRGASHSGATTTGDGTANRRPQSHRHNTDYYYTDDSPGELKDSRAKTHDPYINRHPTRSRQEQRQHHSSHSASQPNKSDLYKDSEIVEPQVHESPSSPTSYSRRRPYLSDDRHHTDSQSITPQRPHVYKQDHATHSEHDHIRSNPTSTSSSRHNLYHPQSQQSSQHSEARQQVQNSSPGHYENNYIGWSSTRPRSRSRGLKFDEDKDTAAEGGAVQDAYEYTSPTARPAYYLPTPLQSSNELVNAADMELKRVQPYQRNRTSGLSSRALNSKTKGNSSDILHSVSISISSRVSHILDNDNDKFDEDDQQHSPTSGDHSNDDSLIEKPHNEILGEDYDVYSPQHTNYKVSRVPSTRKPVVPIQFFHVKPTDRSSFKPAKTTIEEEDEYDLR